MLPSPFRKGFPTVSRTFKYFSSFSPPPLSKSLTLNTLITLRLKIVQRCSQYLNMLCSLQAQSYLHQYSSYLFIFPDTWIASHVYGNLNTYEDVRTVLIVVEYILGPRWHYSTVHTSNNLRWIGIITMNPLRIYLWIRIIHELLSNLLSKHFKAVFERIYCKSYTRGV